MKFPGRVLATVIALACFYAAQSADAAVPAYRGKKNGWYRATTSLQEAMDWSYWFVRNHYDHVGYHCVEVYDWEYGGSHDFGNGVIRDRYAADCLSRYHQPS